MTTIRSIEPVSRGPSPMCAAGVCVAAPRAFAFAPTLVAALAENRRLGVDLERSLSTIRTTLAAMAFAEEKAAVAVAPLAHGLAEKLVADGNGSLALRLANGPLAGTLLTVSVSTAACPRLDVAFAPGSSLAATLLERYLPRISGYLSARLGAYAVDVKLTAEKGERKNGRS